MASKIKKPFHAPSLSVEGGSSSSTVGTDKSSRDEDIPILKFNEGMSSNFVEFKRKLANRGMQDYGNLARIIEDPADYWVPTAVPPGDAAILSLVCDDAHPDNYFIKKQEQNRILKANERREAQIDDMISNRPAFFAMMMAHLSLTSKHKVKEHEDWDKIYKERNPLLLWKVIQATHIAPTLVCDDGHLVCDDGLRRWTSILSLVCDDGHPDNYFIKKQEQNRILK
jgi:hypothetical protein